MVSSQSEVKVAPRGHSFCPHELRSSLEKEQRGPVRSHWALSVLHWPIQVKTTRIEAPGTITGSPAPPPLDSPSPPPIPSQHGKIAPPSQISKPRTTTFPVLSSTSYRAAGHSCIGCALHKGTSSKETPLAS